MIQRKRFNVKLLLVEHASAVSAREFLHGELERKLQIGRPKRGVEENTQTFRSEYIQWRLTSVKMQCAEQARDAVKMISVQVSYENRMDAASLHAGLH